MRLDHARAVDAVPEHFNLKVHLHVHHDTEERAHDRLEKRLERPGLVHEAHRELGRGEANLLLVEAAAPPRAASALRAQ